MWVVKEKTEKWNRKVYRKSWKLSKKNRLILLEVSCVLIFFCILAVAYLHNWGLL